MYENFFQLIQNRYNLKEKQNFDNLDAIFETWDPSFIDRDGIDRSIIHQIDHENSTNENHLTSTWYYVN